MSHTVPIYIPLAEGLDLSKSQLAGNAQLTLAENVDFAVAGEARGRPGRNAAAQFAVKASSTTYAADADFVDTGFRASGLMRLKDGTSERPMLGTAGRLFAKEGTLWRDRGAFACFKVDQPHVYYPHTSATLDRMIMGPDFGASAVDGITAPMSLLSPSTLGFEKVAASEAAGGVGTMARCGTMTATVTVPTLTNNLRLVTRSNGATTLTDTTIATDAAQPNHDGDAPVICCDSNQTVFFVIYQTTTANQYKVLKVTTAGSVSATFTGTLTGIHGHWVSNSSTSDNVVVIGLTNADGLTIKVLNATTMADNAKDSTHGTVACDAREVVVGVESGTRVWWAYRSNQNAANVAGLRIGTANPGTAASQAVLKTYFSVSNDAAHLTAGVLYYSPCHQPVLLDGRMYLSIACYGWTGVGPGVGTWFTLDLSNLSGVGVFSNPTLAARGRTDGHAVRGSSATQKTQPDGAVLLSDATGWTFPSAEWRTYNLGANDFFSSILGETAVQVLNRVTFSGPRSVLAGGATLFSGSVLRALAGDECFEAGFPLARPQLVAEQRAGVGALAAGSYTIYACWVYTDGAGQVHRSATVGYTPNAVALNDAIDVYVQTPYFHERTNVQIEVYCTGPNPADEDPAFLQSTFSPAANAGATKYRITAVTTDTRNVYTQNDEFQHVTPAGDGGIAALGRRVWVADSGRVYASLLMQPNAGVTWNDEGSLSVDLPAGAGRVVALETLGDKLAVFCERGVFALQDGGPSNTGIGPDISFPIRVSDLGCAGPRSTCSTDRGVVFCSPLDATDPQRGGPWLLDGSLSFAERKYLGNPALNYFLNVDDWVPEVAFSPERQQIYVTVPDTTPGYPPPIEVGAGGPAGWVGDGGAALPTNTGVVVIDTRMSKWSTWSASDLQLGALTSIEVISGVLWDLRIGPADYSAAPGTGTDDANSGMYLATTHMASDGRDGLGWGRVRSVSVLGPASPGQDVEYDLVMYVTFDGTSSFFSDTFTVPATTQDPLWPTSRPAPEWLLPRQKCSTLKVMLAAEMTARFAAIRLDVRPLATKAPASLRS